MAFLDTVRHHGRRTAIQLTVALIAAVAVASPASADGADPCPRPEGSGAFVYRNGDLRPLQPVRDAEVTYHFGINNLRQTVGFYIDGGAVLGPDCTYPLNANH